MSLDYAQQWFFENKDVDCVLFIHLIDPHLPYSPPGDFARMYNPNYQGEYAASFNGVDDFRAGRLIITPPLNQHLIDLYDGEITYMDNAIGAFLSSLNAVRLLDGATVIFAADHGEEFLDHGSFEHGHSMYNELLHVPLIIKGKGFTAGAKVDETVSPMDLFATILARYGADVPDDVQALDIRQVMRGKVGKERKVYSEQIYYGDEKCALTDEEYKYIYHPDDGSEELYELTADPREKTDLAEDRKSICRERREFVQNFIVRHQAGFHVRFNRKFEESGGRFAGTISCDAGISGIVKDRLGDEDVLKLDGNTLTFDIRIPKDMEKGFVFNVGDASADVAFDVTVDGSPGELDLVHIGPEKEIPGAVPFTLAMNDPRFSLGQPVMLRATDPGMYIWAINPGLVESPWENLSSEEEEQLRNLGYLTGG